MIGNPLARAKGSNCWIAAIAGSSRAEPNDYIKLSSNWKIQPEYAESFEVSKIEFRFTASKVFLVITPPPGGGTVGIMLDGKPITSAAAGADVKDGAVTLDTPRLYELVNLKGKVGEHTVILRFDNAGTQAFVFTFG